MVNDTREYLTEDRQNLVLDNLNLVDFVIQKYLHISPVVQDYEDYRQEGRIGLILAAIRFDTSREIMFSTFAVPYISGYVKKHRRDFVNGHGVKVSRNILDLIPKVMSLYYEGFTFTEIQERLGLSSLEMQDMALVTTHQSLEDLVEVGKDGSTLTLADVISNPDDNIADCLGEDLINEGIQVVAETFRTETRKNVWYEYAYLSMYGDRPTQEDLARKYGMRQPNIGRIIRQGKERLKKYIDGSGVI